MNYLKLNLSAIVILMLIVASCTNNGDMRKWIDNVRAMGDSQPDKALAMLNARKNEICKQPKDIVMKYDLTRLRLEDKANIIAASDSMAKTILKYYEANGTTADKQEAYYYAGSVYRDLHDTPRAMNYFLKAMDIAENNKDTDSIMLRNTYSNLSCLFFYVQDYQNLYKYAKKEYDISQVLRKKELNSLMHLGTSLVLLKKNQQANAIFKTVLDSINTNPKLWSNIEITCSLLSNFVYLENKASASKCMSILDRIIKDGNKYGDNVNFAYGEYNNYYGDKDVAIASYKRILNNKNDVFRMYDAAKALFYIYHNAGETQLADQFAEKYIQISDSINFGKMQELAATVNNAYLYYKDKNEEERIVSESERFQLIALLSLGAIVVILLSSVTIIVLRRNRYLKEKLKISEELSQHIEDKKRMQTTITEKERLLSDMNDKNISILNMLHKEKLEEKAEDVVSAIRQACEGRKMTEPINWQKLYKAVDELHPTFKEKLLLSYNITDEKQIKVCYLMKIGLSSSQIAKLMETPRTTLWRWMKKYNISNEL